MKKKRKMVIVLIFMAMLLTLGGVGLYYWYNNTYYVSTDNAQVSADFVTITPQISGKLVQLNAHEGDRVVKNEVIGRMAATGTSGLDDALLRAPINGLIVKTEGNVGEFEPAGSPLALVMNPSRLYVTANIEETKLAKVKPGQPVDVNIDEFGGLTLRGQVESLGEAANSAFSLLPSYSGGTFTKVVQTVPVKIALEKTGLPLRPGTSAVVKIRVK
ncbi:putative multidrug resistance protein EmrK [Peptococcaceae bacterium CEB3]|nr:putative multidrug resistance protein EmrK [Peptococcaceae bacterium CEB3]